MVADPSPSRVLVTRPAGSASDLLCERLSAAGYRVYAQPMLKLDPLEELDQPLRQMALALDNYQHVIFISANAVRFGLDRLEDFWPQLPVGLNWYAIGEATARLLASRGIEAQTPTLMTSEGLLQVPPLQQVSQQRVLIVKGQGGRDTLRRGLMARGAEVDEFACYRRSAPLLSEGQLDAELKRWSIDAVLLTSGEGLSNFTKLLSPAESTTLKSVCLIVPSARVAQQAGEMGFQRIVIADNATDEAMLRALADNNFSRGD